MEIEEHDLKWTAQTIHQAYHVDQQKTFMDCPKSVCLFIADLLLKADKREGPLKIDGVETVTGDAAKGIICEKCGHLNLTEIIKSGGTYEVRKGKWDESRT